MIVSASAKKHPMVARALLAVAVVLIAAPGASAAAITFTTSGSDSDGPLAASAMFVTSAGQIQLVLSNDLAANVIRSAGQAVSDISFTLSGAAGTLGTTSATGQFGNINPDHSVTYIAGSPTRWLGAGGQGNFSVVGSMVTLEAIGGGQPSQMIAPAIADGAVYGNLNNGFRNFNPYVIGPATFTFAMSGVSSNTTVTSVTFSFGTGPDTFLSGTCTSGCGGSGGGGQTVPEPATLVLFAGGLAAYASLLRRRRTVK